jgi:hypothetical protein
MREDRGPWYLLTAAVLGVTIGVLYVWSVAPVRYINAAPRSLSVNFKDSYRALIAAAFQSSGDLGRARARLELLGDQDSIGALAIQAQRWIAEGRPEKDIQPLTILLLSLTQNGTPSPAATASPRTGETPTSTPPPTATFTPVIVWTATPVVQASSTPELSASTPVSPGLALSPTVTATPTVTFTPTATPGSPFALREQILVCEPPQPSPQLQVEALDAAGNPVPGVEVIVQWPGGEEHFFTGLKPELGLGYADFTMTRGVIYQVRLGENGQLVTNLQVSACPSGNNVWGGWRLVFAQP